MGNPYLLALGRLFGWLRNSVGLLWLVVLAIYFSVAAGRAVYANYQEQLQVQRLQATLAAVTLQRDRLQALIVYYNTDEYKELALRANLLLQMPGEQVYALPESSSVGLLDEDAAITSSASTTPSKPSTEPAWKQWYAYLRYGTK